MNDRMKVFHDLCEEHGFLDLFERLGQKVFVIDTKSGGDTEVAAVMRGQDCWIEHLHEKWVIDQIGPPPTKGMSWTEKILESLNQQVIDYWDKKRELKIADFITYLESLGYEKLIFEMVDCH